MQQPIPSNSGFKFLDIFQAIKWIFTLQGAMSFTVLLLIMGSINSIIVSFQQETPMPFFKEVGTKILNYEQILYSEGKEIEKNNGVIFDKSSFAAFLKSIWDMISNVSDFLFALWMFYFFFLLFYKSSVLITNNSDAKITNALFAIILILLFEILGNFIIIDNELTPNYTEVGLSEKFIPLKGVIQTVKIFPLLFNPVYQITQTVGETLD